MSRQFHFPALRRMAAAGALLALAALAGAQQSSPLQLGRSVHGVVLDARNRPLPEAIVYLKNQRSKAIRTVITDNNGAYSFHQLEPNVGYQLYAVWKGRHSPARTDSEYETAPDLRLDLKIPVQ